jgi:hypothetical protein
MSTTSRYITSELDSEYVRMTVASDTPWITGAPWNTAMPALSTLCTQRSGPFGCLCCPSRFQTWSSFLFFSGRFLAFANSRSSRGEGGESLSCIFDAAVAGARVAGTQEHLLGCLRLICTRGAARDERRSCRMCSLHLATFAGRELICMQEAALWNRQSTRAQSSQSCISASQSCVSASPSWTTDSPSSRCLCPN